MHDERRDWCNKVIVVMRSGDRWQSVLITAAWEYAFGSDVVNEKV